MLLEDVVGELHRLHGQPALSLMYGPHDRPHDAVHEIRIGMQDLFERVALQRNHACGCKRDPRRVMACAIDEAECADEIARGDGMQRRLLCGAGAPDGDPPGSLTSADYELHACKAERMQ